MIDAILVFFAGWVMVSWVVLPLILLVGIFSEYGKSFDGVGLTDVLASILLVSYLMSATAIYWYWIVAIFVAGAFVNSIIGTIKYTKVFITNYPDMQEPSQSIMTTIKESLLIGWIICWSTQMVNHFFGNLRYIFLLPIKMLVNATLKSSGK